MWKALCSLFGADEEPRQQQFVGKTLQVGDKGFSVDSIIAEGGFGVVYRVHSLENPGEKSALKKLYAQDKQQLKIIMREINILKKIWKRDTAKDSHIVKFKFACSSDLEKYPIEVLVLTELCHGNLRDYVISSASAGDSMGEHLSCGEISHMFAQSAKAVAFLHALGSSPLIHRDIKPENFLIASYRDVQHRPVLKLCDFGSCTTETYSPKDMDFKTKTLTAETIAAVTTPSIRAPEMLDLHSNQPINEKIDVWALGCLLHFLCHQRQPFEDGANLAIINVQYRVPKASSYGPFDAIIREKFFTKEVAERPTAEEAQHLVQECE